MAKQAQQFKTITWAKNCKHSEHQVYEGIYYCPWINDNKTQFGCSNKVDCPHINKPKQVKK